MPPLLTHQHSQNSKRKVSIHLSDVDQIEPFPDRLITLQDRCWSIELGRGSQSDPQASPQPTNAWYTSKVMSRHHAELSADPDTRLLSIVDRGSMHGTYLNGDRVANQPMQLLSGDVLTFGTNVCRGEDSFSPLKTIIAYHWVEDDSTAIADRGPQTQSRTNTFTADYSDIEIYSDYDDDLEIIHESVRQPSVEIVNLPLSSATTSPQSNADHRTSSITDLTDTSSVRDLEVKQSSIPTSLTQAAATVDSDDEDQAGGGYHPQSSPPNPINEIEEEEEEGQEEEEDEEEQEEDEDFSEYSSGGNDYEDGIDDLEEGGEEQEAIHSSITLPAVAVAWDSPLQVQSSKSIREPSPSDAAMAKPRPSPPPPAPIEPIARPAPPPFVPDRYRSHSGSWRQSGWNGDDTRSPSPIDMCSLLEQPYLTYPALTSNDPFGYSAPAYNAYYTPRPKMSQTPCCMTAEPVRVGVEQYASAAPRMQSHDDILPSILAPGLNDHSFPPTRCLKRKANEISSSDESKQDTEELHARTPPHMSTSSLESLHVLRESAIAPTTMTAAPEQSTPFELAVEDTTLCIGKTSGAGATQNHGENNVNTISIQGTSLAEGPEQPPPKRTKTAERGSPPQSGRMSSAARSAAKYAAVAIASASAGALGTVYALASLPPNYFAQTG